MSATFVFSPQCVENSSVGGGSSFPLNRHFLKHHFKHGIIQHPFHRRRSKDIVAHGCLLTPDSLISSIKQEPASVVQGTECFGLHSSFLGAIQRTCKRIIKNNAKRKKRLKGREQGSPHLRHLSPWLAVLRSGHKGHPQGPSHPRHGDRTVSWSQHLPPLSSLLGPPEPQPPKPAA